MKKRKRREIKDDKQGINTETVQGKQVKKNLETFKGKQRGWSRIKRDQFFGHVLKGRKLPPNWGRQANEPNN